MELSVIVPVYNVSQYLSRCLDSLTKELEYFAEKELILIDDGSTDSSLEICNTYADNHPYIRVIHHENKGLAAVRNLGVSVAQGKFISFIDSDDYVQNNLYRHAFDLINKYDADICCFKCVNLYTGNAMSINPVKIYDAEEHINVFNKSQALALIFFDNYINVITCNKIIKKSCFKNVFYPEGKLYEDMFTTYKILLNANKIVTTNLPFYVYCHRAGSIGAMKYSEKTTDLYRAAEETYVESTKVCGKSSNLEVGFLYWKVVVANMMIRSGHADNAYFKSVKKYARSIFLKILSNKLLSRMRKTQLVLYGICFPLYKFLYLKYIKRNRKNL